MDRKVLCIYEDQLFDAAQWFLTLKAEVFMLDVAELLEIESFAETFTDVVTVGFSLSNESIEKLYMAGKKQILCIDTYREDHPLKRLNLTKGYGKFLDYAGKWAILVKENDFETTIKGLTIET